jgi:putative DNA primase/helicase
VHRHRDRAVPVQRVGPEYKPVAAVGSESKYRDVVNLNYEKYNLGRSEAVQSALVFLARKYEYDTEKMRSEFEQTALCEDWGSKWERLADSELQKAVEFAKDAETQYAQSDSGNARRLIDTSGEDFRYVHDLQSWFSWDGRRWKRDGDGEVHRAAKAAVAQMLIEAAAVKDDERRKKAISWALRSQDAHRLRGMVEVARTEREVSVMRDQFDTQPLLLNLQNGTLNLQTGELHSHLRDDRLTQLCPVTYAVDAKCPRWLQFLEETFPGQPEVIDFLQRSIGYTLTGSIAEQCFWLLIGTGKNGKSVFLSAIHRLLGDYAVSTSFNTFALQRNQGQAINPRDGLASLEGSRFVRASESDEGKPISEALLKALTGGEQVRTARMYAEDYAYDPTFKIWLSTNHEPSIRGTDEGIWRRIHRVNFDHVVPEEQRDPGLTDKLVGELPGILNWALDGLRKYQRDGLRVPDAVRRATAAYRTAQDTVTRFLEEETVTGANREVDAGVLYAAYKAWCQVSGERYATAKTFGAEVGKRFDKRKSGSKRLYVGVGLENGADGADQGLKQESLHRDARGGTLLKSTVIGPICPTDDGTGIADEDIPDFAEAVS